MAPEPVLPTSNNQSSSSSVKSTRDNEPSRLTTFLASLRKEVDRQHTDIPICLCSLVSGLCESVSFSSASVFVSMHTGNAIFVSLGAAALPENTPYLWLRALVSILAFVLGVFTFGQTRRLNPLARGTLAASFLAQALLVWTAAALSQGDVAPPFHWLAAAEAMHEADAFDFRILGPVVLLAFQFGGQIVASRQLGYNEVPTNVLTSVFCDVFNDPKLFAGLKENPKRNRRVATVVLMVVGGICGGWIVRSNAGMSVVLWIAGAVKFGMAVAFFCWKTKGDKAVEEK